MGVALPSPEHEALVRLLRGRPSLAARLLALATDADVLPAFRDARVGEGAITEERAVEYRADLVIELHDWRGRPVAGVIAEVQLRRDKRKRFTWPYYVAALRARLQAPVHLLVVAPHGSVAGWAAKPISMGHPGWTFAPVVLGPSSIPMIVDPVEAAAEPELAVLSAIAHGDRTDPQLGAQVAQAALQGALRLDDHRTDDYIRIVLRAVSEAVRNKLEDSMKPGQLAQPTPLEKRLEARGRILGQAEGRAIGEAEGRAIGEAEGRAKSLLAFLAARGIAVPEPLRAHILGCTDIAQLEGWIARAAHVTSAEALFGRD
jgi:hypothetical protein